MLKVLRSKLDGDSWFMSGSLVEVVDGLEHIGILVRGVRGVRVCLNPKSEDRPMGQAYIDEEICPRDEFENP